MYSYKYNQVIFALLVIVLASLLGFYVARNTTWAGQFKQELFRVMVGQETNLTTAHYNQMQTEHFTIRYLDQDAAYVSMIAQSAEEAYSQVGQMFDRQPSRITTVVVYPNSVALAKSFGWDKDEKAMGVYWGGTIRVLSPKEWLGSPEETARFIKEGPMVHEFAHLLVDDITRGNYNRWWTEGLAQYAEKKITGFEFASPFGGQDDITYYKLDKLEKDFDRLDQSVAYWESLQVVEYIADRYGEDKLFAILSHCGQGDFLAEALQKSLGLDYEQFASDFYQYLENYGERCAS